MRHFHPVKIVRRGSTMILVVSMLVLLVIMAAAFVSRTQAGRVIAGAQQLSAAQTDRVGPIAHAVTEEITQSLFVRPVDPFDAALGAPSIVASASSATPRLAPNPAATRYSVDPLDALNNSTLASGFDGIIDGYNFAPFEVRPWTNWPDVYNLSSFVPVGDIRVAEANPVGNPGFGDARWLRSTEPVRVRYQGSDRFSHWSHLSWIPTANNGWRIVTDIADLETNTLVALATSPDPSQFFPNVPARYGLEIPYEQWLPSVPPDPNLWVAITVGAIPLAPVGPFPNPATPQGDAALIFRQLAFGTLPVANPAGGWFSSNHLAAVTGQSTTLPNFLRLKWFGPRTDEFVKDSPRNLITRTLCDTDGDGFTDSFWFVAPTSLDRSVKHVVGVSVVDNSALVNVNIATRSDPATTGGKTPSDLALVSRMDPPPILTGGPLENEGVQEVGFLSSSRNATSSAFPGITVAFDAVRFGAPINALATVADNTVTPTVLSELGVVKTATVPTASLAFPTFLRSDLERTIFFKAMSQGGEVEGFFDTTTTPGSSIPVVRTNGMAPEMLEPFTMADELELRAFTGQNNPYVRSRLERAMECELPGGAPVAVPPVPPTSKQFLRSAMSRAETSEFYSQLDAAQLLKDNRRKLTTVSGARNDLMPPWLWTMPPVLRLDQIGASTWVPGTDRSWRSLVDLGGSYTGADYYGEQAVPVQGGPNPFVQFPLDAGVVAGDGNCDGFVNQQDVELARSQFLEWNRKVDLNQELSRDDVTLVQSIWNQHDYARDVTKVLQRSLLDVDSRTSIFGQENDQAAPGFNRFAVTEARRAIASWTANILAARDGPRKFSGMNVAKDEPLHPARGIVVEGGNTPISFIGQEKHPFIVQVFFAVVYPKTGTVPAGTAGAGASYVCFDKDDSADKARVVLAVQIANPYNEPIELWPFRLRAFGQYFSFVQPVAGGSTDGRWGYGFNPILGPATEEAPRTAVVFAIPKDMPDDPAFRLHMMNFLDLTHPWMRIANSSIPTGAIVPKSMQDEIATVSTTEVFPADATVSAWPVNPRGHDLFEDPTNNYADSLVFNASMVSGTESAMLAGANKWSVKPSVYFDKLDDNPDQRDIAITRLVGDPLGVAGAVTVVVDRLENQFGSAEILWSDALKRMLTPPDDGEVNEYVPPKYVAPDPMSASQQFAHVDIGSSDFLMSWTRISRPWSFDIDSNKAITADERSPRFVFARNSIPKESVVGESEVVSLTGPNRPFRGDVFATNELLTTPDNLAVRRTRDPFGAVLAGKPTNFSLRSVRSTADRIYPSFDDIPAAVQGEATNAPWPGTPGATTTPVIILGDTGADVPSADLDFYRHPLRMTQRDGAFEQIAEVFDVPVWGPMMQYQSPNWTTLATYGEMMVGGSAGSNGQPLSGAELTGALARGSTSGVPGYPTFGSDGAAQRDTMRFQFDRNRPSVLSVVGFVPALPGGASLLDGFTLDGAGTSKVDTHGVLASDPPDGVFSNDELLAAENRRLRLAGGFSSVKTNGLININTAPIEVIRALPQMQQLVYNTQAPGLGGDTPWWNGWPGGTFSEWRTRVPDSIINYRDRFPANINGVVGMPLGPKYDDRGFVPPTSVTELFPFHPGMRGERGFVSVGELALIDREYRPSLAGTMSEPDPEEAFVIDANWATNKSWGMSYLGRDPYRTSEDPPVQPAGPTGGHATVPTPPPLSDFGAGWRSTFLGGGWSAQMATERLAQTVEQFDSMSTPAFDPILSTARVAGDQVERNTLLKGIANLVTTRSDVFTVYLKIRSVAQNAATGAWDATDPSTLIDESRYILVVDRSGVDRPGEEPKILMFEKIQE